MAGEISPDIMFRQKQKKYMDDPGWVRMGFAWVLLGVGSRGDSETSGGEAQIGRAGHVLHAWSRQQKSSRDAVMVTAIREDRGGQCRQN